MYFGHVTLCRMTDFDMGFFMAFIHRHCHRGRLEKKWIDSKREDCVTMNVTIHEASCRAWDMARWKIITCKAGCQSM